MGHHHASMLIAAATACVLTALPFSASHAADKLTADGLLDPTHVVEVKVTLPAADWEKLRGQSRDMSTVRDNTFAKPFTYFRGDVTVDGVEIKSVGIRKKGFIGSLDSDRPSLKIKFAEFEDQSPVVGLDRLTLNNNKQDTSQVSQYLSYRVFRDAGVHACRSNFARVTVNDEFLGIYSHIESVKADFLARSYDHDKEKLGNLYEGTLADLYLKSIEKIEAKTNKKDKTRPHLTALAELVSSDEDLDLEKLDKIIDTENFLWFWAAEGLVKHWDGYNANQNNYYIYFDPANDRGYFMPWGTDSAWHGSGATCISAQSMLGNRLYHTEGVPERYRQTMLQLLDEVWDEDALLAEVDRIEELITPHLHKRQKRTPKSMDKIRAFIRRRREEVNKSLSSWPVKVPSGPRKPMYTVPLVNVTGTFSTIWYAKDPPEPMKAGKVKLAWQLADANAMMVWRKMGVTAKPLVPLRKRSKRRDRVKSKESKDKSEDDDDDHSRVIVTFTGQRLGDRDRTEISVLLDRDVFENGSETSDRPIDVTGLMLQGNELHFFRGFGDGPARGGKMVTGQLYLTKSGTTEGDPIEGRVDLKIVESRGG